MKKLPKQLARHTPPKSKHCPLCLFTIAHLKQHELRYECARLECPIRRMQMTQDGHWIKDSIKE